MKDEDGEFIGPLRVYMREKDMPSLAMTRSFGTILVQLQESLQNLKLLNIF